MMLTAIAALLPVFFVLGLGYFAGRAKKFDADQVAGLNELVLDFAPPIFQGLFGASSLVSIALAATISAITIVPLTLVLLELHRQHGAGGEARQFTVLILRSVASSFKMPMVWAPLIGVALVLAGVRVPQVFDNMLTLIGSTTSGASI